jgi:hypothetical protein
MKIKIILLFLIMSTTLFATKYKKINENIIIQGESTEVVKEKYDYIKSLLKLINGSVNLPLDKQKLIVKVNDNITDIYFKENKNIYLLVLPTELEYNWENNYKVVTNLLNFLTATKLNMQNSNWFIAAILKKYKLKELSKVKFNSYPYSFERNIILTALKAPSIESILKLPPQESEDIIADTNSTFCLFLLNSLSIYKIGKEYIAEFITSAETVNDFKEKIKLGLGLKSNKQLYKWYLYKVEQKLFTPILPASAEYIKYVMDTRIDFSVYIKDKDENKLELRLDNLGEHLKDKDKNYAYIITKFQLEVLKSRLARNLTQLLIISPERIRIYIKEILANIKLINRNEYNEFYELYAKNTKNIYASLNKSAIIEKKLMEIEFKYKKRELIKLYINSLIKGQMMPELWDKLKDKNSIL